jgi:hypothetical protein
MINLTDPAVVNAARKIAGNISKAHGLPELDARAAKLRAENRQIESTYRETEAAVDAASSRASTAKSALKEREDELLAIVTEETIQVPVYEKKAPAKKATKKAADEEGGQDEPPVEDAPPEANAQPTHYETKPRFTNDTGRKAAVANRKRTDEEYCALKAELTAAEQALMKANEEHARAKAAQRALNRDYQDLVSERLLAAARIAALAGLEAPEATPTPSPAPTQQPAAIAG